MKKMIPILSSLAVFAGMPASFTAAAFHRTGPLNLPDLAWLFTNRSDLLASFLFVSTVMSVACILVHHLRENHRLAQFASLYSPQSSQIRRLAAASHKPRLATA